MTSKWFAEICEKQAANKNIFYPRLTFDREVMQSCANELGKYMATVSRATHPV